MNTIDLEKTRIFERKAKEAFSAAASARPPEPSASQSPASAPKVKQLTKEEKALLASGGVLSLAFGTILVANLPENTPEEESMQSEETTSLETPTLALEVEPEIPAETESPASNLSDDKSGRPGAGARQQERTSPEIVPKEAKENLPVIVDVPEKIEVSTKVSDAMNFDEALIVARTEVGPGGLFVWKDTYYTTYTEQEWGKLSDNQKEQWISIAEPVIDPVNPIEPEPIIKPQNEYLSTAERGEITWTGVDKNGDGQAEVLIAQSDSRPPVVMMDADGDGLLDTRYDLDPASGVVYASSMEQTSFSLAEVHNIPEMNPSQVFVSGDIAQTGEVGEHPVLISEQEGSFIIAMDLDDDALVDVISLKENGRSPFVAMDMDNDGHIETSFVFDQDQDAFLAVELEPMNTLLIGTGEDESEDLYGYEGPNENLGLEEKMSVDEENATEEFHAMGNAEDPYFDNQSDLADDFIGMT
ncbi:MAG: hypothetical protein KKG00_06765 [Bacteroidetes bacterium]|nr:hypothetical protein [Bacteroidota bacterium]